MEKMSKRLTWYGHNCFLFEYGKTRFLIDPFLADSVAPLRSEQISANYLLVSHGHADHCANALEIAKRSRATVVGVAEVAGYFAQKGVQTEGMNIGGSIYLPVSDNPVVPQAQIMLVEAPHSSTMPDNTPGGNSAGFLLSFSTNGVSLSPKDVPVKPMRETLADARAFTVYFACDTGFFSEMNWIGTLDVDVAVLPIGDRYTMGPSLSLEAIRAVKPRFVVPAHFNTWAPISQDSAKWSEGVLRYTDAIPLVLNPGKTVSETESGKWE